MKKFSNKEKAIYNGFTKKQKAAYKMVEGVLYTVPSQYREMLDAIPYLDVNTSTNNKQHTEGTT